MAVSVRKRWPRTFPSKVMNEISSISIPEDTIVASFQRLPRPKRTPTAFLGTVLELHPALKTRARPRARSWADVAAFLAAPQLWGLSEVAEDWKDEAKVAQIALRILRPSGVDRRRTIDSPDAPSNGSAPDRGVDLCGLCWRIGRTPQSHRGFGRVAIFDSDGASPVRCARHTPLRATARGRVRISNISEIRAASQLGRQAAAIEDKLMQEDRRLSPAKRFWLVGDSIIMSQEREGWTDFLKRRFPHVCEHQQFKLALATPEGLFQVLDDEHNHYTGRYEFHRAVMSDRELLSFYLMPMLLRADIWLALERQQQASRTMMTRQSDTRPAAKVRLPIRRRMR